MFSTANKSRFSVLPWVNKFWQYAPSLMIFMLLIEKSAASSVNTLSASEHELFKNFLAETCTSQPYLATNNVAGTTYVLDGVKFESEICYQEKLQNLPKSPECVASTARTNVDKYLINKGLDVSRKQTKALEDTIGNDYRTRCLAVLAKIPSLTPHQEFLIDKYFRLLMELWTIKVHSEHANLYQVANCGEQSDATIFKIIKKALEYDIDIKLQYLLSTRAERDPKTLLTPNHQFVLIDSDLEDVKLTNKKDIEKFIQRFKTAKGYICDTWNNGLFVEISKNKNNIYDYPGVEIELTTLSPKIDLKTLPKLFQDFYTTVLEEIGIKLFNGRKSFSLYSPPQISSTAESIETTKPKLEL